METDRLKQLQTLAQTLNLRKAADLLQITPGGLSKSLKTLEHELGFELFTIQGRSLIFTDQTQELLRKIPDVLEKILNLKSISQKASNFIRIATFEVFSTYFLRALIKSHGTGVRLELLELTPGHLEQALIDNRADMGVTYIPIPRKGLDYAKVGTVEMAIFGIASHKNVKNFLELPFVVPITPITDAPTDVRGLDGWPDHEISRNVCYRVELLESALELCRMGVAVGYFPRVIVDLHNECILPQHRLIQLEFSETKSFKSSKKAVYIIRRSNSPENSHYKKTARAIRLICKSDR